MTPVLSIIIPVFNRGELIRHTLESVRRASVGLTVETIIVDDGSTTPAADDIARVGFTPARVIRQDNQGLLFARLTGLRHATGRYTLFLDSDDLVGPEKFRAQIAAMDRGNLDVSYTDTARTVLTSEYDGFSISVDPPAADTSEAAEFFITVQPAPHSPMFRTDYLRAIVDRAFFPPSPLYNSVAEIWFYHNAAPFPARVARVPGAHTIVGVHPGVRLTSYWEKLAVASLAVMEAFARACPATTEAAKAKRLVGEKAFGAWRRLPRDFSPVYGERLLALWRRLAPRSPGPLGGRGFQALARVLGAEPAAKILRQLQGRPYAESRTMDDATFTALLNSIPPA